MSNEEAPETPKISWDDSKMQSAYANVVNVAGTREEISVFFGTNRTWNPSGNAYEIELSQRMLLTPFAAKRLLLLLGNAIKQYESKFGELQVVNQERPEKL